jgi:tetratricopeptide (TPR) repeat protein
MSGFSVWLFLMVLLAGNTFAQSLAQDSLLFLQIDAYNEKAWQVYSSAPDQARHLADLALKMANQSGYPAGKSDALSRLALIDRNEGKTELAIQQFEQSLEIRRQLGDSNGIAGALNNLGIIQADQGKYQTAQTMYLRPWTSARG